jgi:hypothetical protein
MLFFLLRVRLMDSPLPATIGWRQKIVGRFFYLKTGLVVEDDHP